MNKENLKVSEPMAENPLLAEVVLTNKEANIIINNYLGETKIASWEFVKVWVSKKGNIMFQKFWEDDYTIELLEQVNLGKYADYNFA